MHVCKCRKQLGAQLTLSDYCVNQYYSLAPFSLSLFWIGANYHFQSGSLSFPTNQQFPTKRKYSIHRKVVSFLMANISDIALICLMFVLCLGKKDWSLINKYCCRTEVMTVHWETFLGPPAWAVEWLSELFTMVLLPVVSAQDTLCCTVKNTS